LLDVQTPGPYQPSHETMLKFYSYYKQATQGPCNIGKPGFWDIVGKAKWYAEVYACINVSLYCGAVEVEMLAESYGNFFATLRVISLLLLLSFRLR
jgi:hypothetical protein